MVNCGRRLSRYRQIDGELNLELSAYGGIENVEAWKIQIREPITDEKGIASVYGHGVRAVSPIPPLRHNLADVKRSRHLPKREARIWSHLVEGCVGCDHTKRKGAKCDVAGRDVAEQAYVHCRGIRAAREILVSDADGRADSHQSGASSAYLKVLGPCYEVWRSGVPDIALRRRDDIEGPNETEGAKDKSAPRKH